MPKPIEDLDPGYFAAPGRLTVDYGAHGQQEGFTLTRIGRVTYAVSIQHGYAYTRRQLIEKYRNVAATWEYRSLR